MNITHTNGVSAKGDASFCLVNKRGSFCSFPALTNYQGLQILEQNNDEWGYYKIIDDVSLEDEPIELRNHLFFTERLYNRGKERFFFVDHGLIYDIEDYEGSCMLDLDCRGMYDQEEWGKKYVIEQDDNLIFITYRKTHGATLQKQKIIVIKGAPSYDIVDQWIPKKYSYDTIRHTKDTFFVYRALRIHVQNKAHLQISYGNTVEEAMHNLATLESRKKHLFHLENTYIKHLYKQVPHRLPKEIEQAYLSSLKSLEDMVLNLSYQNKSVTGVFAGIPWFHYFWTRDELISLKGLLIAHKYNLVKVILLKHLHMVHEGRIPNRTPIAHLGTADGIGWLFKRLGDFIDVLKKKRILKQYVSKKELDFLADKAEEAVEGMEKYVHEGLVWNKAKETWMDTDNGNDTREAKRLEINVLYCNMLNVTVKLMGLAKRNARKYKQMERKTVRRVREAFFNNNLLWDGDQDATVRPNIFLAYYIFPQLLRKKEWKTVFMYALDSLWLEWGGLASIDKKNPLFTPTYAGETNTSYHRGDSWYWVNNIAAMALHQVDSKTFWPYLDKMLKASVHDCLYQGFAGHCSEISSAKSQDASGTWCQSWSNATLLELIKQIYS